MPVSSPTQWQLSVVMAIRMNAHPVSIASLARDGGVSRQAMSEVVGRLIKQGLARKTKAGPIRLTAKGERAIS